MEEPDLRQEPVRIGEIKSMMSSGNWYTMLCFSEITTGNNLIEEIEKKYYWGDDNKFYNLAMIGFEVIKSHPMPFFVAFFHKSKMKNKQIEKMYDNSNCNNLIIEGYKDFAKIQVPFLEGKSSGKARKLAFDFLEYVYNEK
jgi:hypothetical protein